jgi:mannosyltransferase
MANAQSSVETPVERPSRLHLPEILSLSGLGILIIAAVWLRLHALDAKSLWMDEGLSTGYMRMDWYNLARLLWRREANMSFYFLLLSGWIQFGDSVAWYRGFSVLASVATIPVLYGVGKRMFGNPVGLVGAAMMTLSAYHVRYAQEARSYGLTLLLVTLATYFFATAVQNGRRDLWRWYVASSVLAIYSHFFAVLVVVAHWASMIALPARRERDSEYAITRQEFNRVVKRVALWTLPMWVFIATTGVGVLSWMRRPGLSELYSFLEQFAGNGGAPLLGLYVACGFLAALAAIKIWRIHGRSLETWRYAALFSWLVVPVLIPLTVTFVKPMFLPRYVSISLPALFLIAAAGLSTLKPRWLMVPLLALIAWFAVVGIRSYYERDFDVLRADYRLAAGFVLEHAQPGDAILFYPAYGRFAYEYYVLHSIEKKVRPSIVYPGRDGHPVWRDFMGQATPQVLDEVTCNYRRVWFVFSNYTGPESEDPRSRQIETAILTRFRMLNAYDFPAIRLYLYAPGESGQPGQ